MSRLPVVVGFGGVNPAGRSSFHHGYRRLVSEALPAADADASWRSLAALMGLPAEGAISPEQRAFMCDHTLVRRLEKDWFDADNVPFNRRMALSAAGEPIRFTVRSRDLPDVLPPGWRVAGDDGRGGVRVEIANSAEVLVPSTIALEVRAAGQLPTGFDPAKLYPSRSHPRGLQMAIYAASDALQSTGIAWEQVLQRVRPDQVSVYASSAMAQLDEQSNGGLLSARANGKRVTSKQVPLGLADMPSDFVNAYVLGNVGNTGPSLGACATFLFNLRHGVEDIRSGRARVAIVGASEAPLEPAIFEGYATMGALATDAGLLKLDEGLGLSEPDYRRACRPFSDNCGFTLAEAAQFVVLFDDELALELGANIHAAVSDVFTNADGYKKSISSPGIGNYLTMAKAVASARAILGEEAVRHRSFVQAHGTGTPQNRVTESHILNEIAKLFGIDQWPLAAIKAYLGHTIAAASGDQLVTTLGVWRYGIIPGIRTIDHVAADVHTSNLAIEAAHREIGADAMDIAILNAKGFGGNNASAVALSPAVTARLLQGRHGKAAWQAYRERNVAVQASAEAYDAAATAGTAEVIYRFDHNVLQGEDLRLGADGIHIPGFEQPVELVNSSPYSGWLADR